MLAHARPRSLEEERVTPVLRRLRTTISELRTERSVASLLARGAEALCHCAAADGAALIRVDGHEAMLQTLFCARNGDVSGTQFQRPPFSMRPFSTERAILLRPRATPSGGEIIGVAAAGRQPWPVSEMQCIAAPIRSGGRGIGLACAIWTAPSEGPGAAELEMVWAFAEALGAIVENVWLLERLHLQLEHVRPLLMAVGAVLGEVTDAAITLDSASAETLPSAMPGLALGDRGRALGDLGLTGRELQVLGLMAQGATNKRIAAELMIADTTVKSHVRAILRKLQVSNRAEAASRYATRNHAGR
jgi:DNA-binding CsgD family transcriptional regulator